MFEVFTVPRNRILTSNATVLPVFLNIAIIILVIVAGPV